jgi:hypothetical protein
MNTMSIRFRGVLVMAIGFTLGILVSVTGGVMADRERGTELPYEQARLLAEVLERVREGYVEPVDDRELIESAVRGMLKSLDDHSGYLDPEQYRQMRETTSGRYGGLGLEVTQEDGVVKVIAPIDDTPAGRAGVESGTHILEVDGESLEGVPLDQAVRMMRGEPGSRTTLKVLPPAEETPPAERPPAQLVDPMLMTRESAVSIGSIGTTGSSRSRAASSTESGTVTASSMIPMAPDDLCSAIQERAAARLVATDSSGGKRRINSARAEVAARRIPWRTVAAYWDSTMSRTVTRVRSRPRAGDTVVGL